MDIPSDQIGEPSIVDPRGPTGIPAAVRSDECKSLILRGLPEVEQALKTGVLRHWAELMERDPYSTVFQGPEWAMSWYRSYDTFEPLVIALLSDSALVGLVPLAIEKATDRLTFCGDGMADYKDVVARPGLRRRMASEFLTIFQSFGKQGTFAFGSTLSESDTVELLTSLAADSGIRFLRRQHFGWQWVAAESTEDFAKKKSVRNKLNYYRRTGELRARLITRREDWETLKDEFYSQHSLRQRYAGRPISFDSPQKRAFYDALFEESCSHFTVLEFNQKLIAAHFGCVRHGILYWGAPSFDITEKQCSPNLLLLVLAMQNREDWGFPRGVDLTIGTGDMKQRFSTTRVDLPWIDLFASAGAFYPAKFRLSLTKNLRQLANKISEESWDSKLKPGAEKFVHKLKRAREMGLADSVSHVAALATRLVGERGSGLVYRVTPGDVCESEPKLLAGENCLFHENEFYDLLLWKGDSPEVSARLTEITRLVPELSKSGRTLHTVVINERLATWGISYWPKEPAEISEAGGAALEFLPDSVSLYDFYTLPEFRRRKLYQALLVHILRLRFSQGAKYAYLGLAANNVASRKAVERVGFRLLSIHRYSRFLKWKKLETRNL